MLMNMAHPTYAAPVILQSVLTKFASFSGGLIICNSSLMRRIMRKIRIQLIQEDGVMEDKDCINSNKDF
jgi:hypothetical protein